MIFFHRDYPIFFQRSCVCKGLGIKYAEVRNVLFREVCSDAHKKPYFQPFCGFRQAQSSL
ncbi:hypothetical protein HMPREF1705_04701 [Acetomicrobium hydrogeniformans ATCC BAA-1850]|uniref:Uncharacterized protein n=1 Tax=Acetomicrobium hydrogeniformans ATCC BAA-1850 TaxID=592015 RepID=A0A0T5XCK1_9BACT|nr:hypothetical protein HMPREF1705_04701 [Acetomicrobium hydrogeniformans ATCC BAA-1850]